MGGSPTHVPVRRHALETTHVDILAIYMYVPSIKFQLYTKKTATVVKTDLEGGVRSVAYGVIGMAKQT